MKTISLLILTLLFVIGCAAQPQVQKADQIQFNDNVNQPKVYYLKTGKAVIKVLGSALQPILETSVLDSVYSPSVGITNWVRTKGFKILSGYAATADGGFGVSGRRSGDSTAAFNKFLAVYNDSILGFIDGSEVIRLNTQMMKVEKDLVLANDAWAWPYSPRLVFGQLSGGNMDSAWIGIKIVPFGANAIQMSSPITFLPRASNGYAGLTSAFGINGDSIIVKGTSSIARINPFGAAPGQVLAWDGSQFHPEDQTGGVGGAGALGARWQAAGNSFNHYGDTNIVFDKNFTGSNPTSKQVNLSLVQNIGQADTNGFGLTTLSALRLKNGTSNYAQFTFAPGALNMPVTVPNLGTTPRTMAFLDGGQSFTNAIWQGTPIALPYLTQLDRSMIVDSLNSLYSNKHFTRYAYFDSGMTAKNLTLKDPTFTGTTLISQPTNSAMMIANTGSLYLDMPSLKFTNSPSMPYTGTMSLQNMSGNRSWVLPDRSGTFVVSASAPFAVDPVTGNLSMPGGFVQSIAGQLGPTVTMTVGSTGSTPNIVAAVNNIQFNFPLAGIGVSSGLVSNTAQSFVGMKTMNDVFTTTAVDAGVVSVTGTTYSVDAQGEIFRCDPTGNGGFNMGIFLPAVAGRTGRKYEFYKLMATPDSRTVTITPNGTEKIAGQSSIVLTDNFDYVQIWTDGVSANGWQIRGKRTGGELIPATALISSATDSAWYSIAGFDSAQGWVGGWTYTDAKLNNSTQMPVTPPVFYKHTGGIGIKANMDWIIDNVEISFVYKMKK